MAELKANSSDLLKNTDGESEERRVDGRAAFGGRAAGKLRRSRIISCQQKEMKEVRFYSSRSLSDRPKTEAIGSVRHAVFCHIILVRKQEQRFLQKRFFLIYFHFIDSEKQKKNPKPVY